MIKEGKIGFVEIFALLFLSNIGRVFLTLPASAINDGRTMVWLLVLLSTAGSLITFWIVAELMKRHQKQTIVEVSETLLGPYLGTLVNIVFFLYFVAVMAFLARGYAEAILVTTLPRTPISIVLFFFFAGSLISCYYGLEVLARVARLSITFVAVGIFILFISVMERTEVSFLFPIFSQEPGLLVYQAIDKYTLVTEGLLAAVIILSVSGGWQKFKNATYLAILLGGITLLLVCMSILLIFGVPSSNELLIPFFNLSRLISLGRYFQRVEAVFLLTWVMVGMIKLAVTLYAATLVAARTLKVPDYRPLLWVVTLLCAVLSIIPPDLPTNMEWESEYLRSFPGLFATAALPFLLLIVSRIRKKEEPEGGNAKAK